METGQLTAAHCPDDRDKGQENSNSVRPVSAVLDLPDHIRWIELGVTCDGGWDQNYNDDETDHVQRGTVGIKSGDPKCWHAGNAGMAEHNEDCQ